LEIIDIIFIIFKSLVHGFWFFYLSGSSSSSPDAPLLSFTSP
jgi:hypothetical protein